METFDRNEVDPWFLSGETVVRLWGRDFAQSPEQYAEWLLELAQNYQIEAQLKVIADPPGVLVRAYIGKAPKDKLVDPLIVVNREQTPWLFCSYYGAGDPCQNRIKEGFPPGSICAEHEGGR